MNELSTLIERIQQGESEAYGAVIDRFQDMAVSYAYAILGEEDTYQGKKIGRTKRYSLLFFEPGRAYCEELLVY